MGCSHIIMRSTVDLYTVRKQWSVQRDVNVFPMDALTRSDHRSEGGTSKSLAKAHFVHWHILASWTPLCWCKSEETPADTLVALHQHWCQWRIWPPESSASRTGRPSRTSGERTLLFDWPAVRRYRTGNSYSAVVWKVQCSQPDLLYFQLFYTRHITSIFSSLAGTSCSYVSVSCWSKARPGEWRQISMMR